MRKIAFDWLKISPTFIVCNLAKLCRSFFFHMKGKKNTSREGDVDGFRGGNFELFALYKTKMKRNGGFPWYLVFGMCIKVQENIKARESVRVLLWLILGVSALRYYE